MQREQFTNEQRLHLALDYHKLKGKRNIYEQVINSFRLAFPGARIPVKRSIRLMYNKLKRNCTVLNCNSKASPGLTYSGSKRTVRTPLNTRRVKNTLIQDARKLRKNIGRDHSPLSSSRRNRLGIKKSSFNRITKDLNYHPYKPMKRQKLMNGDPARRLAFSRWMVQKTELELEMFCFSDEANFDLNGHVNSQNIRQYAVKKTVDREHGGCPDDHIQERSITKKLMVFAGVKADGIFGLKFLRNESMNEPKYKRLLQYTVLPQLRANNGGDLTGLTWAQDGAPCHTARDNVRYLNRQFGPNNVISIGARREWPARSPDLNPLDFFLWGYLKSKVYYPHPRNIDELELAIQREVQLIDPVMCRNAVMSVRRRAVKCIEKNGKTFER